MTAPAIDPRPREGDVEVPLAHRPGALARLGDVLGAAGVNLEGGGAWADAGDPTGSAATAHFLVDDLDRAAAALRSAGFPGVVPRPVVTTRLRQEVPGELAVVLGRLADAGVQLIAQYSDHGGRLVLVVDRPDQAREALRVERDADRDRDRDRDREDPPRHAVALRDQAERLRDETFSAVALLARPF